jgi:alpha-tubulin suppressor-like RCC1 family protein
MDSRTNLSIHHLLVLNQYFQSICSNCYPRELIHTIIGLYYKLFKIKIAYGRDHFMVLFDGEIYSWGDNKSGQLGLGHYENTSTPTKLGLSDIIKISCGYYHSVALTRTNRIYVWGNYDQLGLKGMAKDFVIGTNYPLLFQSYVFNNESIKQISCGRNHSMVLTKSGKVYGWGYNFYGQLGTTRSSICPLQELILKNMTEKEIRAKKINCANNYSMVLAESGIFFNWGSNMFGQFNHHVVFGQYDHHDFCLEYGFGSPNVSHTFCADFYSVIVIEDEIYFSGAFALDGYDRRNLPKKINFPNLKKLACGNSYFMILNNLGEVYVQGYNTCGQLGLGHMEDKHQLQKLDLPFIKKIVSKHETSFAITEMNEIYVWGKGYDIKPQKFTF